MSSSATTGGGLYFRPDKPQVDEIAAALHARTQRAADVDQMAAGMRSEPAGAHLRKGQHQPFHRLFGGGDFRIGHLREVFFLQHLAVGHGHARVEFDFALALEFFLDAGEQRLLHARRSGRRRLRLARRRRRQHHCHKLVDITAAAKEDPERLIEQHRMLVPFHEHRVQRPVKVLARADARGLHRFECVDHRTRPDRNPGRAQGAREIKNIFRKPAVALRHLRHRYASRARAAIPRRAGPISARRAVP